jgi:hypothetical protein
MFRQQLISIFQIIYLTKQMVGHMTTTIAKHMYKHSDQYFQYLGRLKGRDKGITPSDMWLQSFRIRLIK